MIGAIWSRVWIVWWALIPVGLVGLLVWPTIFGTTLIVLAQLWRIDRLEELYDPARDADAAAPRG
jgi:hypothetical protein